jgi:hypothetical protein
MSLCESLIPQVAFGKRTPSDFSGLPHRRSSSRTPELFAFLSPPVKIVLRFWLPGDLASPEPAPAIAQRWSA